MNPNFHNPYNNNKNSGYVQNNHYIPQIQQPQIPPPQPPVYPYNYNNYQNNQYGYNNINQYNYNQQNINYNNNNIHYPNPYNNYPNKTPNNFNNYHHYNKNQFNNNNNVTSQQPQVIPNNKTNQPFNYWEPNKSLNIKENNDDSLQVGTENQNNNKIDGENIDLNGNPDSQKQLCEICHIEERKYKCPGCGIFSCSLKCVKNHKSIKKCDGKFKAEKFISKSHFTEKTGYKDYNYLNGMITNIDKVKKHLSLLKKKNSSAEALRYKLLSLYSKKNHNIELQYMPYVFLKHRENLSFYFTKKRKIYWSLEIFLYDPKESDSNEFIRFLSQKPVCEDLKIEEVLLEEFNFFNEELLIRRNLNLDKENLKKLIQENKIKVFKEDNSNKQKLTEIDLNENIVNTLKSEKIIEFPKFVMVYNEDIEKLKNKFCVKN